MEVAVDGVSIGAMQVGPARGAASRALQPSCKSFIEDSSQNSHRTSVLRSVDKASFSKLQVPLGCILVRSRRQEPDRRTVPHLPRLLPSHVSRKTFTSA